MEWGIAMNRSFQKQLQDIEEGDYQTKEEQEAANHQREIILWLELRTPGTRLGGSMPTRVYVNGQVVQKLPSEQL